MKRRWPSGSGEIEFLSGPQSRWEDFKFAIKTLVEFIKGFRKLHFIGPCVTFFGSARFDEHHPYYKEARLLSQRIARLGFTILTGGGPGLMEAANRGAKDVNGRSVGCNDRDFHKDLIDHIEWMKSKKTISEEDLDLILFTDSMDEVVDFIKDKSISKYGLANAPKRRPLGWLFEKAYSQ